MLTGEWEGIFYRAGNRVGKMLVTRVKGNNFRNYTAFDISLKPGVTVFIGENAQGKTNLLEALFLAVLGKSFRASQDEELIFWGCCDCCIQVDFINNIAAHSLTFNLSRAGNRENILNGHPVRKKEIIGCLNAVFFSPEDLLLIKGTPSMRRRFLDFEISQMNPVYYQTLIQYNRTVGQRNRLLKQINEGLAKRNLIRPWNDILIPLAARLVRERKRTVHELTMIAQQKHDKISNGAENLSAYYYVSGMNVDTEGELDYQQWYGEVLEQSAEREIRRGATEYGPHKDDLCILINKREAKIFASQGQQRTAVLSLKLAEIELMRNSIGEYPILLLDDVMSELDENRRTHLIEEISERVQTFITGTDRINTLNELKPQYYIVNEGKVFPEEGR